jgi:hypothetical protein
MIFLLFSVLQFSQGYAKSCKVDLGDKVEAFESENCTEKDTHWVVQACNTKKFCKVSNKKLVTAHQFKCPKTTGNPKLDCISVPSSNFDDSTFSKIKNADFNKTTTKELPKSDNVFFYFDKRVDKDFFQKQARWVGLDKNKIIAYGSSDNTAISVCASNIEVLNTKYFKSVANDSIEECKSMSLSKKGPLVLR